MKSSSRRMAAAAALLACCNAVAALSAGFAGRSIVRSPDMCDVDLVDTVTWYAQESVRLEVEPWRCGRRVEIPAGATAAWVVADEGGTNWIVRYDDAPISNRCAFALAAGEGALPEGHDYTGYVSLLSGTNILGVLDRHGVVVLGQAADGGSEVSPVGGAWGSLLQRMSEVEHGIQGLSHDVATNAAAIVALEEKTNTFTEAYQNAGKWVVDDPVVFDNDVVVNENAHLNGETEILRLDVYGTNRPTWNGDGLATVPDLESEAARLDGRLDSLYAECTGGFRWPDYFTVSGYEAGILPGTLTNWATGTQMVHNVLVETGTVTRLKGWRIDTDVFRYSDWDGEVRWEALEPPSSTPRSRAWIDPDLVRTEGGNVYFADGVADEDIPSLGPIIHSVRLRMRGTLGGYSKETQLEWDPSKQATTSTVRSIAGPAPGSLLEAARSNVLAAAHSRDGAHTWGDEGLRLWPEGYGSGTNHVTATWNTNFWGYGLGDFSCISYHTDYSEWKAGPTWEAGSSPGGVYQPLTMVTPRHAVCANHFRPQPRSNNWWVTRSGGIVTNRVVDYKRIRGDLTVARLDHAFDTNDIRPAKLLAAGWHSFLYGATNAPNNIHSFGVPVVTYDCAERGYVMFWMPRALYRGRGDGAADDDSFGLWGPPADQGVPYARQNAVEGDSGSPVFWPIDGTNMVLLGCFFTGVSGPIPTKEEVDAAIAAWGDKERVEAYDLQEGGWPNPDMPVAPGAP